MLAEKPRFVQDPLAVYMRDNKRIPVGEVDLPARIPVNSRARDIGIFLLCKRQRKRVSNIDGQYGFRLKERGKGDIQALPVERICGGLCAVDGNAGQAETPGP